MSQHRIPLRSLSKNAKETLRLQAIKKVKMKQYLWGIQNQLNQQTVMLFFQVRANFNLLVDTRKFQQYFSYIMAVIKLEEAGRITNHCLVTDKTYHMRC